MMRQGAMNVVALTHTDTETPETPASQTIAMVRDYKLVYHSGVALD